MQIEVKGRNVSVSDDLREHVEKRFRRVDRQVSELAVLEVELRQEELTRQVKRHRDKRRGRRKGDTPSIRTTPTDALGGGLSAAP